MPPWTHVSCIFSSYVLAHKHYNQGFDEAAVDRATVHVGCDLNALLSWLCDNPTGNPVIPPASSTNTGNDTGVSSSHNHSSNSSSSSGGHNGGSKVHTSTAAAATTSAAAASRKVDAQVLVNVMCFWGKYM